jgi:hypothetical protein
MWETLNFKEYVFGLKKSIAPPRPRPRVIQIPDGTSHQWTNRQRRMSGSLTSSVNRTTYTHTHTHTHTRQIRTEIEVQLVSVAARMYAHITDRHCQTEYKTTQRYMSAACSGCPSLPSQTAGILAPSNLPVTCIKYHWRRLCFSE